MVSHRDRQHYTFPYTKESLTRALNKINCILEWKKHNGYCLLSQDGHSSGEKKHTLTSILEHELEE